MLFRAGIQRLHLRDASGSSPARARLSPLVVAGKRSGMAPRVREIFRNSEEVRTVPAGTVIFTAGDVGKEMFGIVSGMIELRVGDDVIAKLGPDEVFGELALVDKSPRMATAIAVEDAELAVISERLFLILVHDTPMFALHVMASMAERLR